MMGKVVALIPVRGLHTGKTRLASDLSPEARVALTERMLRGVIRAAAGAAAVDTVAVISPDQAALALARSIDPAVETLTQWDIAPGLNAAVEAGRAWAERHGTAAITVLFGDLPLLTANDVRRLVTTPGSLVLAPDRHGTGTNALRLRLDGPGRRFRFQFGADSLHKHLAEAERVGLDVATITTPGTAYDLDTPEDWRALSRADQNRGTVAQSRTVASAIAAVRLDCPDAIEAGNL